MKKLLALIVLFMFPIIVSAEDITSSSKINLDGNNNNKLTDKNENSYATIGKNSKINIESENDIYGVYIIYELKSVEGSISNSEKEEKIARNGYLHEYIDVSTLIGKSKKLTISYNDDVKIGEIYVLSSGDLPEFVEKWEAPYDKADLLLFSTHSDDEQLFFAGLMPYYVAKGANVQVVYFTNHFDNPRRLHEQLHGLYTVGIRNYPIIGFIPDAWSESLNGALNNIKKAGYSEEDAINFEVEMIRRFKPLVVVGHDEKGEYSHGQHILNTYVLEKAILLTNDENYHTESKEKYGLWDTPKTYLHLYKENQIIMNYDEPLDYFNGETAYEISKKGYSKHISQQYTWFTKWLTGVNDKGVGTPFTKASQIKKYSPCEFGLYRSLVGEDINKNDMFENLTLRKDEIKVDDKNNETIDNKDIKSSNDRKLDTKIPYYLYSIPVVILVLIILSIKKNKH